MMLAKIEGKKLFFSEYTQEELAKVKDLLSWEGDDYHPSETLLLEENGQFYTFWGLYSLLAKKIKLEVVNPREDEVYELPSIENTLLQGITLHDYQVAAIRKCLALKRGIVSIPTAGGKTEICIGILEVLFRSFSIDKALIVVPTFGLAEQFYERFLLRGFPGDFVGRIHGECRDTDKPITIGVINSLIRGYRESPEIRKIIEESQAVFFDECIDGEHYVATQFGYKKLKTLNVGDEVITPFGRSKINKIWKTKKLSYEVTLRSGKKFIVSKDHLVPTFTKKEWQEHQDNRFATLKIDKIENSHNLLFFKETINFDDDFDPFAYFLGWFIGDGTLYPSGCRFSFRKDIDTIRGIFLRIGFPFSENKNSRGDTNFTFNAGIFNELKDLGFKEGSKCLTCEIPKKYRFNKWTIRGLFEAEGAFTGNRIVLDMVSKKCIDQISSFLFCNGIMNTVHSYPSKNPKHNTRHRIAIFGDDIERFYRLIGNSFYQKQNNRLATLQRRLRPMVKFDPIVEMKEIGERELYDISLDDKNKLFIVEGYLFHNCHHIQASTWTELALGVKNDEYLLCFSGTPFHADDADDILDTSGDALTFGLAGKPIFELRQKYLVDKGIIARPFVFFKSLPGQLSKYPGRFNNIYKTHIVNNSTRNELIVKFAKRFQEIDFPTLILVQRKEHALNLMEMMKDPKAIFVSGGANAVSYDSNGMVEEFKIDYNVFRSNFEDGQWNILIATQVFDEAIDIPSIQSLIMAGAGRSKIKQLQRLGRGVRKKKDKINHAYIVDFIDRGHVYLFAQYKKRRQRYEDLEIEIIADEMEFNRLLYWHKEELKNDLVHG